MSTGETFQAFFSHAGHDAKTDKELIDHCSDELEQRVKSRVVYDKFVVWRDKNKLNTGDSFDPKFVAAARASHFLIVVLTPQWIASKNCRKEYEAFREVEKSLPGGDYIIPILARDMKGQRDSLTSDDREVYDHLMSRQYRKILAVDFLQLSKDARLFQIEHLAQDIERMISRRKGLAKRAALRPPRAAKPTRASHKRSPVNARPLPFPDTDFLRRREVVVEKKRDNTSSRRVLAQADFVEQLYVRDGDATYNFGVHRAVLKIDNDGPGLLEKSRKLDNSSGNSYYLNPDDPGITVVTEPTDPTHRLGEMAFSATEGENYYAEVAIVSPDVAADQLKAKIEISVCPMGLTFPGERFDNETPTLKKKLEVVLAQFITKTYFDEGARRAVREITVKERDET